MLNLPIGDTVVVPVSGGIDSTLCAYAAKHAGKNVLLIHFDFGKRASTMEMHYSKLHAAMLGVNIEIVNASGLKALQLGYVPINTLNLDELDMSGDPMPKSDITGFHIMMSLSSYYAQLRGAQILLFGVIKEQSDERPQLNGAFKLFSEFLDLLNPKATKLAVFAPLIGMSKSEVVISAIEYGVSLEETWSCTEGGYVHCGKCFSCLERKNAFVSAGISDPTLYNDNN